MLLRNWAKRSICLLNFFTLSFPIIITVNSEQGFAAAAAGTASSWAGWAVNSLTSKISVKNSNENQTSNVKNSSKGM